MKSAKLFALDHKAIKLRRHKLKLTMQQCADRVGWSLGRWNDVESGRFPQATADTLGRVCQALEIQRPALIVMIV
jgi:transcriptional regulator with XRE-family HTH domain